MLDGQGGIRPLITSTVEWGRKLTKSSKYQSPEGVIKSINFLLHSTLDREMQACRES